MKGKTQKEPVKWLSRYRRLPLSLSVSQIPLGGRRELTFKSTHELRFVHVRTHTHTHTSRPQQGLDCHYTITFMYHKLKHSCTALAI